VSLGTFLPCRNAHTHFEPSRLARFEQKGKMDGPLVAKEPGEADSCAFAGWCFCMRAMLLRFKLVQTRHGLFVWFAPFDRLLAFFEVMCLALSDHSETEDHIHVFAVRCVLRTRVPRWASSSVPVLRLHDHRCMAHHEIIGGAFFSLRKMSPILA
jgi:hypothetical protein